MISDLDIWRFGSTLPYAYQFKFEGQSQSDDGRSS